MLSAHTATYEPKSVEVVWSAPDDTGRVVIMTTSYYAGTKTFTTSVMPAVRTVGQGFTSTAYTGSLMAAEKVNSGTLSVSRFSKKALWTVADDAIRALPALIEANATLRGWFEEISAWGTAPAETLTDQTS